jgi:hypothetical protein
LALPRVSDKDCELGCLVTGVGNHAADSREPALISLADLGHDCHFAIVVDKAEARGYLMRRFFE